MLNLLSLFSGIGAFEKALDRLGIEYRLVNYCEIDKYASKSYSAIHGVPESMNLGDITKIDTSKLPKNIDLITYGFPCQDISLAGKQKGFEHDGERTRSGLFFEALRIIEDTKPKFAICENVKNLTSKKFSKEFEIVLSSLEAAGYTNYWKVLNAKDYGVPQNRERVFIVSIRKDIDKGYEFPEPFELKLRLKDMLDEEVDEKYYMSEKSITYVCATGTKNFHYEPEIDLEVARPLTATMHKMHRASQDNYVSDEFIKNGNKVSIIDGTPVLKQVAQLYGTEKEPNPQAGRVYDADGLSPTMDSCSEGNRMPKVLVREATKKGYAEAYEGDSINLEQPNSKTRRGRVGRGVAQTLTTGTQQVIVEPTLRIRKLTPKECYLLMGFDSGDFYKAEKVNSNTQLYKQAGNSIVVDVLEYILEKLIERYKVV